jgi:DNA-binding cell septation regulator SpoVG
MNVETWAWGGVSVATGVCGVWAARAARRTPRQEKRDDFTVVTKEIRTSLADVKKELAEQKAESARQDERLTDQALALEWLQRRLRDILARVRNAGLEVPPAEPIPERARKHIHIDV